MHIALGRRQSRLIDERLRLEKQEVVQKGVVLGICESGKRIVLRGSERSVHPGYNADVWVPLCRQEAIACAVDVVRAAQRRDAIWWDPAQGSVELSLLSLEVSDIMTERNMGQLLDMLTVAQQMMEKEEAKAFASSLEYRMSESTRWMYFLVERLQAIMSNDYFPSPRDCLLVRDTNAAMYETRISCSLGNFVFVNPCRGRRTDRKKMVLHFCTDVDTVVFVADLCDYATHLEDDASVWRIHESLRVWEDVLSSKWMLDKPLLLVFTGVEKVGDWLAVHPLHDAQHVFPNFCGPSAPEACVAITMYQYTSRAEALGRKVRCVVTRSDDLESYSSILKYMQATEEQSIDQVTPRPEDAVAFDVCIARLRSSRMPAPKEVCYSGVMAALSRQYDAAQFATPIEAVDGGSSGGAHDVRGKRDAVETDDSGIIGDDVDAQHDVELLVAHSLDGLDVSAFPLQQHEDDVDTTLDMSAAMLMPFEGEQRNGAMVRPVQQTVLSLLRSLNDDDCAGLTIWDHSPLRMLKLQALCGIDVEDTDIALTGVQPGGSQNIVDAITSVAEQFQRFATKNTDVFDREAHDNRLLVISALPLNGHIEQHVSALDVVEVLAREGLGVSFVDLSCGWSPSCIRRVDTLPGCTYVHVTSDAQLRACLSNRAAFVHHLVPLVSDVRLDVGEGANADLCVHGFSPRLQTPHQWAPVKNVLRWGSMCAHSFLEGESRVLVRMRSREGESAPEDAGVRIRLQWVDRLQRVRSRSVVVRKGDEAQCCVPVPSRQRQRFNMLLWRHVVAVRVVDVLHAWTAGLRAPYLHQGESDSCLPVLFAPTRSGVGGPARMQGSGWAATWQWVRTWARAAWQRWPDTGRGKADASVTEADAVARAVDDDEEEGAGEGEQERDIVAAVLTMLDLIVELGTPSEPSASPKGNPEAPRVPGLEVAVFPVPSWSDAGYRSQWSK